MRQKHFLQAAPSDTPAALTGDAADAIRAALAKMHERDRERVMAGEIKASDLHLIPAEMARRSIIHWTPETTTRFKG